MEKKSLLITFMCFCALCLMAQPKRAASITHHHRSEPEATVKYYYDDDNRLTTSEFYNLRRSYDTPRLVMSFVYDTDLVTIDVDGEGSRDLSRTVMHLEDGRVAAYEMYGVSDGRTPDYSRVYPFELQYDEEGHLVRHARTSGNENGYVIEFLWEGENMSGFNMQRDSRPGYPYEYRYEYGDDKNPAINPIYFELQDNGTNIEYGLIMPYTYLPQLFGTRPANLLTKWYEREGDYTDSYTFEYAFDDEGDITEVIVTDDEDGNEYEHFWVTYEGTSGVADATTTVTFPKASYSLDGRRLQQPAHGICIEKSANGVVKRVCR